MVPANLSCPSAAQRVRNEALAYLTDDADISPKYALISIFRNSASDFKKLSQSEGGIQIQMLNCGPGPDLFHKNRSCRVAA
jgi:hypothetical protein